MARPTKTGLDYFPLDCLFFESDEVEAISGEFGIKGELVCVKLLCAIYHNGYFIKWNELTKGKFLRRLPGVSAQLLEDVVQRLLRFEFFNEGLYDSAQVLTSKAIQTRWKEATRKRLQKSELELEHWLLEVSGGSYGVSSAGNPPLTPVSGAESTQTKLNETKPNETKLNPTESGAFLEKNATTEEEGFIDSSQEEGKAPPVAGNPPAKKHDVILNSSGVPVCSVLHNLVNEFRKANPKRYTIEMYTSFLHYWSEPNERNVPKWYREKSKPRGSFHIGGRLGTWYKKESQNPKSNDRTGNKGLAPKTIASADYQGSGNVGEVERL